MLSDAQDTCWYNLQNFNIFTYTVHINVGNQLRRHVKQLYVNIIPHDKFLTFTYMLTLVTPYRDYIVFIICQRT